MSNSARRSGAFLLAALLVAVFATGCTLAGASAAPLTPVASDGSGNGDTQPGTSEPQGDGGTGETVPTPTEMAPIDVFGTQTAMAPPPTEEPTAEETVEETPAEATPAPEDTAEPTEESTAEPTEEPAATQEPAAGDGQGGGQQDGTAACPATVTVQSGENLFRIALRYNLTTAQLAAANGITNPDTLQAGTVLNIPGCDGSAAGTELPSGDEIGPEGDILHVVQPGENLYRIALQYGMTWQVVANYNGITNPDAITVGQTIRIPQ